jgi:hypothetical protein
VVAAVVAVVAVVVLELVVSVQMWLVNHLVGGPLPKRV